MDNLENMDNSEINNNKQLCFIYFIYFTFFTYKMLLRIISLELNNARDAETDSNLCPIVSTLD